VIDLLRNTTYVGELPFKGESFPSQHEPIVERELFDVARLVLDERGERYPLRRGIQPSTCSRASFDAVFATAGSSVPPPTGAGAPIAITPASRASATAQLDATKIASLQSRSSRRCALFFESGRGVEWSGGAPLTSVDRFNTGLRTALYI
jgi:hypothetical protein